MEMTLEASPAAEVLAMERATCSRPLPGGPEIRTLQRLSLAASTLRIKLRAADDFPTKFSNENRLALLFNANAA